MEAVLDSSSGGAARRGVTSVARLVGPTTVRQDRLRAGAAPDLVRQRFFHAERRRPHLSFLGVTPGRFSPVASTPERSVPSNRASSSTAPRNVASRKFAYVKFGRIRMTRSMLIPHSRRPVTSRSVRRQLEFSAGPPTGGAPSCRPLADRLHEVRDCTDLENPSRVALPDLAGDLACRSTTAIPSTCCQRRFGPVDAANAHFAGGARRAADIPRTRADAAPLPAPRAMPHQELAHPAKPISSRSSARHGSAAHSTPSRPSQRRKRPRVKSFNRPTTKKESLA